MENTIGLLIFGILGFMMGGPIGCAIGCIVYIILA